METSNTTQRCLMAVLAHPDDETFGMGGTLALYAKRGVKVHLVCATRGEVGEVDAKLMQGFASVGDLREHELHCAAQKLGLSSINFLGYRDSGMRGSTENQHAQALMNAPIDQVTSRVVKYYKRFQPQVVITFDPLGGYMHPDHIAIQKAAAGAFFLLRRQLPEKTDKIYFPQKLYFHTFPRKFIKLVTRIMPLFGIDPSRFGRNHDINLMDMIQEDFPITTRINYREVAEIREQAFACHASQGGGQKRNVFITWLERLSSSQDTFMRAFPRLENGMREQDLFEGI